MDVFKLSRGASAHTSLQNGHPECAKTIPASDDVDPRSQIYQDDIELKSTQVAVNYSDIIAQAPLLQKKGGATQQVPKKCW